MKKGKRKLYFGHGIELEQSPGEDDFRSKRCKESKQEAPVEAGCSKSTPPTGRKKKEGRLSRKSSTKKKLLENSSLSSEIGMENDNTDPSEMILKKKCGSSGTRSVDGTDKGNVSVNEEGDRNVESPQMSNSKLVESEASDYDFSYLHGTASHKILQNHRHISKDPVMRGNKNLVIGADEDAVVKDFDESNQKSVHVSEQSHGSQNQCDDVRKASGTQEMFITQKDPKCKSEGLSPPFADSKDLMTEDRTRRMKSAKKQHHLTISKVKQLKRSSITKAVMARHSSCPTKLLVSSSSEKKNKDRVRTERFMRKVKELQEKRKIAGNQSSSFEQSPGDSQLSLSYELSESPQEHASGTQMFSVAHEDLKSVEAESQSLIPPMVADDDSEEAPEEDTFQEVLAMRLARKKQRRRHNSSGIFGLSPLEETLEDEIGDGGFVEDVSKCDEGTVKGDYPEARSQCTLGEKEADLSQEPDVKEGVGSTAKDVDVESSSTPKDNSSSVDQGDIAFKPSKGLLFSTEKEDHLKDAESSKVRETHTAMKDVIVLETQSEQIEPEIGEEETVSQKNDVTVVPESHDLLGSSLPRYHFTSDDDSSNELHDESVTQAVSKFLDTFEDCANDRPPWEEVDGQGSKPGTTKERTKDKTRDTFKTPAQTKDSGKDNSGLGQTDLGSSKCREEIVDGCSVEGIDERFDDIDELDKSILHSGPVTKKKARSINKEVMKRSSRHLNMSENRKRSVSARKDGDTNLLKKGRKLKVEANEIFVRADVHAVDMPTVTEEASNDSGSFTSEHKKNPSTVNSSQSRSHEEAVCPMEASKSSTGIGTTINVGNVSTDPGDSSQETCLPEDYDNVGSVTQETVSPGSRCDKGGELGEREMFLREVASSADVDCEIAASISSGMTGRLVDNSVVEVAVTSPRDCGKCGKVKLRATYAQTDITMQDLQSKDYFDFCMEFKRLLLEYDKSVISTSGSGSFGSSTSESNSRDNHRREDLMVLARRVCDLEVGDKTLSSGDKNLSSDEATYERLKRKKKRKMVDNSCQMGSPSKGLEKPESEMHSEKVSTSKEYLSESFTDLSVDMEEFGDGMERCWNVRGDCSVAMNGDISSGNKNMSGENYLEREKQKVEKGKSRNAKKRKKNEENVNLKQTKEKKKKNWTIADPSRRKKEKLADGQTKKKKKPAAETSFAGRKKKLVKEKTKKGKKLDDTEDVGETRKEKKAKKSDQTFDIFDIPIENIPSPEEVKRQWKRKKTKEFKRKRNRKEVSYRELSSCTSDSFGEVSGSEKRLLKKKRKLKKKKDSKVDKAWKLEELDLEKDFSSDSDEQFYRRELKEVSGKRKKVHKHKKKKHTSDDSGGQPLQDTLTTEASLLPSPQELQLQYHNYFSSDDTSS